MAYIKFDGFDELENDLSQQSKQSSKLSGNVSFGELFNDIFMQDHTSFSTIEEFFEKGGFKVNSEEEFDAILQEELDKFIALTTSFDDWEDMLGAAVEEYTTKKLGLD